MEEIGQFVVSNTKQPGGKTVLTAIAIPRFISSEAVQGGQKGLRGKVLRVLLVAGPGQVIDVDPPVMALVKRQKLARVLFGLCGQDRIGGLGIFHN